VAEGKGKRADELKAEEAKGKSAKKRAEAENLQAEGKGREADQAHAEAAEAESESGDVRDDLKDLADDLDDLAADSRWGHQLDPVKFQLAKSAESVRQAIRIINQFSVEAGDEEDDRPRRQVVDSETGKVVKDERVESSDMQDVERFGSKDEDE